VPLLARDDVAADVIRALRDVAEQRVGALTDALLDADTPFVVKRRLARVFSVCGSQRAVDSLLYGLDDLRFEVRYHCARSLAAIHQRHSGVRIDATRVLEVVRREVTVSKRAWEGRQVTDQASDEVERSPVAVLVAARANRALEHVFTLIGLVASNEAVQIAYRALHTTDKNLRGTALEYLDIVLPADIRDHLWPFIDADVARRPANRPPDEVLGDLLRSHQSILLSLERDHPGTAV
jgi:HEAT repeat protein